MRRNTYFGKLDMYRICFSRRTSSVSLEYVLLIQTLRRKFVSESFMRSNLCAHNCNILFRSSRKRNLAEIMGTRGRACLSGDVRGGPNISESSSFAFNVVVGSVIVLCASLIIYIWLGWVKFNDRILVYQIVDGTKWNVN